MSQEIGFSYSQISTQVLVDGLSSKMSVYHERLLMALPLDGKQSEPLTDENLENLENDFTLKQQAAQEVFKVLNIGQDNNQNAIKEINE